MKNILSGLKKALFPSNLKKNKGKIEVTTIAHENEEEEELTGEEKNRNMDEVYLARQSNDLEKMLKATELNTTLNNRHFLLQDIVSITYNLRKEEKYKNLCLTFSEKHLKEFDEITKSLKEEFKGFTPVVTTFQYYSTLLTELEEYEKAIKVCEIAISYKLKDGTKGCYQGRISRIKKKMTIEELKAFNIQNESLFSETNLTQDENKFTQEEINKEYSEGEIKTLIREIVREAKVTAKEDTGYLKRSIQGNYIGLTKLVVFTQIYYGAINENSKLLEVAINKMPKDLKWTVILLDDDGRDIFRKT